jgi:two-component system response regulator HydG
MAVRYLPVEEDTPIDNSQALVKVTGDQPSSTAADMQMLYRTLLQLAGDVNEMKTVLRHLLSLSFDAQQSTSSITPAARPESKHVPVEQSVGDEELNLGKIEKMAIEMALRRTQGSRREAAKILGISERTLYRKIEEYGLQ